MKYTIGPVLEDRLAGAMFDRIALDAHQLEPQSRFVVKYEATCDHDGEGYHGYILRRYRPLAQPNIWRRWLGRTRQRADVVTMLKSNHQKHFTSLRLFDVRLQGSVARHFIEFATACELTDVSIELNAS